MLQLVKVDYYTLPNLLTDSPLVPEFIQRGVDPATLAGAVGELLDDPERRRMIQREFAKLRTKLALNADQRAADAVIELAHS
jgi:lipid-A-disaccharide synthase